mmetsp:Transcript_21139/g.42333  ORF Transcript_21139/g.42333 Transcript_21139/m.42333 type:complete len:302 (-) Transcript_21139:701-1606(-)
MPLNRKSWTRSCRNMELNLPVVTTSGRAFPLTSCSRQVSGQRGLPLGTCALRPPKDCSSTSGVFWNIMPRKCRLRLRRLVSDFVMKLLRGLASCAFVNFVWAKLSTSSIQKIRSTPIFPLLLARSSFSLVATNNLEVERRRRCRWGWLYPQAISTTKLSPTLWPGLSCSWKKLGWILTASDFVSISPPKWLTMPATAGTSKFNLLMDGSNVLATPIGPAMILRYTVRILILPCWPRLSTTLRWTQRSQQLSSTGNFSEWLSKKSRGWCQRQWNSSQKTGTTLRRWQKSLKRMGLLWSMGLI